MSIRLLAQVGRADAPCTTLRPSPKAKPADPKPDDPLIPGMYMSPCHRVTSSRSADATPAWPDVRPQNGYCLPRDIFIPHIDRILTTLGIPVESRTSMITAWLPSLMRHKNIVGAQAQL